MPVFLLSLCIVAAICLLIYGFIVLIPKLRKDNKIESKKGGLNIRDNLLAFLVIEGKKSYRKKKNMDVLKIRIMEKFNLMPDELKIITIELEKDNVVTSDIENVAITPFGIEYYNSFIKQKEKK